MPSNFYKVGMVLCLLVLLAGSILQTLGGVSYLEHESKSEWGLDDAYISYRYSENLMRGEGLVFNYGERVEGYSNLLYVLAVAPAFWVTNRDGVYFFSVLLNILCALGALWRFSVRKDSMSFGGWRITLHCFPPPITLRSRAPYRLG